MSWLGFLLGERSFAISEVEKATRKKHDKSIIARELQDLKSHIEQADEWILVSSPESHNTNLKANAHDKIYKFKLKGADM